MSNETNLNAAHTNNIIFGKGGKMYKNILFLLAAALAVGLFGTTIPARAVWTTIPNVVGMTEHEAKSEINSTPYHTVGDISYEFSDTVPFGCVISQNPAGGTWTDFATSVDLVISNGPLQVRVPYVEGMAPDDAESALEADHFAGQIDGHEYNCRWPEGYVIDQDPMGGMWADEYSSVSLTISLGPPIVPDVEGMAQAAAESAINSAEICSRARIEVGTISYEYIDTVPEGHVISQNPAAGTRFCGLASVDLTVSLGPLTVPDVVGMSESDAESAINSADLSVGSIGYLYSDTVEAGRVISQYPIPGTVVDSGTEVDLDISLGPDTGGTTVEVPDVVGMSEPEAKSAITSASLNVGTISNDYSDTVPKGFVISQSPSGGTSVPEGSTVSLRISLGPEPDDIPPVPVPPDASCLVAHWKLDEIEGSIAYDSSGNSNHGMVYGNPIWQPTGGMLGGALELDGVDDSVVHSFAVETWSAYTVTLWVKTDTLGQDEYSGVFSSYIPSGAGFQIDVDGGYPGNYRYNESSDQLIGTVTTDWVHLAAACDGSIARLYYNGNPAGTIAVTDMMFNQFAIGVNRNADKWFGGIIDDVRIYDCALSADNILQLLNAEPIECLVGHWKLDEIEGAIAYDNVGDNDGILYGNPIWQPTVGIIDGALEFDGDGDYLEIPKIGDSVEFTYAMWVGQNQVISGLIALIDHKDWVYGSVQFELRDGHPKVGINGAITPAGDLDAWGHTLAAGEWHHVALAKSATELLMYVDGEEAARRELITSDTVILGDGFIGAWVNPIWGQTRYFDGLVDDVRIYDCALDENQIKALTSLISAPPSLDPLSEALDTSLSFTTGGSADWFSQTTTFHNDGDAAQSGDISGGQESWMQTTVSGKGTVKFYWMVSSEQDFDCLEFYIDGVMQERISGLGDYWQQKTYTISTSGLHTLEWRYMKDGTTSFGSDCGWLDKVEWITTP